MSQGKRKVAEDDDELSDAATGSAGDTHEAKKRRSHTNSEANADTCAVDEHALPPSSSSQRPKPMPHIPAPVWGHVLDYMPYGEVRSALLLGKIIATEAAKHVQTLNIMNSWEMDVPAARRFANVTEVNILSLVRFRLGDEELWKDDFYLCGTTAERTVPFIVGFPKLQRIRAGGIEADSNFHTYANARHEFAGLIEADNSGEILQILISSFTGAFSTRLLPTTVESLLGITSILQYTRPCRSGSAGIDDPPTPCGHCSKILKYFPIKDLITPHKNDFTCFSTLEELNMLADRQGFKERCRELSEKYLVNFIGKSLIDLLIEDNDLCERLQSMGVTAADKLFSYLDSDGMAKIDRLVALGFDPKSVSQGSLYDTLRIVLEVDREFDVYGKSTFEFLVSRGFPLAEADLILLDKAKEPALKELRKERDQIFYKQC